MINEGGIVLSESLHDRLVDTVRARWPEKTFGYLISRGIAKASRVLEQ